MVRDKKYSTAEPVTDLRHIKIIDNMEPLVNYLQECPNLLKARSRWQYERVSFLRASVAGMLCKATEILPNQYRFAVLEGWRPEYIQKRMYLASWKRWKARHPDWSDVQLRRVVNRFTAPIHGKVPPPHSTGGAFDILLADIGGNELDMTSPFEAYDPRCFESFAAGLSNVAMENRKILFSALETVGLTNYPSEWWHWSFGDQGWAYRTKASNAIYDRIEPNNFQGIEVDKTEADLVRA